MKGIMTKEQSAIPRLRIGTTKKKKANKLEQEGWLLGREQLEKALLIGSME